MSRVTASVGFITGILVIHSERKVHCVQFASRRPKPPAAINCGGMLKMIVAYLTLFGWSFLAATVLPLGSEAAVVLLVRQGYSIAWVVTVATAGNYLGACTTYWIGRAAARALRSRATTDKDPRATRLLAKYGAPALLLSWVPLIGDAIVAAAGVAQIAFLPFSMWTITGKFLRYVVVAWGAATW